MTSVAMVVFYWVIVFMPIKDRVVLDANVNDDVSIYCSLPHEFTLKWRHSVEKQYWQEVYEFKNDTLILTKTYTQTFGAGVPSTGKSINAPKGYIGQLINQSLPQIRWVVSTNMKGKIIAGDESVDIYQMVPDYTEVVITPKKLSLWRWYDTPSCFIDSHKRI